VPVPWSEITIMSERLEFVRRVLQRRETMAELCAEFRISEKTGYKWMARFRADGAAGLADRSHAPLHVHRMADAMATELLAIRQAHPTWGPRKLIAYAKARNAARVWPAPSSVGALLKRAGLVRVRRVRAARSTNRHWGQSAADAPNDVWTADFKGQFRLGTGAYCYPLTVADVYSRFLLGCTALHTTDTILARAVFARLFEEYGLPRVLRTDNGIPFAAPTALGQLSALAVWWIRLGIQPERIAPGKPQQNGRHERMHRTLKAETTKPAAHTWRGQQRRFDQFRTEFNGQRPHEALGQQPPASWYTASVRPYPRRLPRIEYAPGVTVRRVTSIGQFAWRGRLVFLSSVLAGQDIGLEEVSDEQWAIAFGPLNLAYINPSTTRLTPAVFWRYSPINSDHISPIIPV
jgi:transposase InsO family protein